MSTQDDAVVIIDVREPFEYAAGHVSGALNMPLEQLSEKVSAAAIKPDTPIVTYCRSGGRAGQAVEVLRELGYTNVTNGINQANVEQQSY